MWNLLPNVGKYGLDDFLAKIKNLARFAFGLAKIYLEKAKVIALELFEIIKDQALEIYEKIPPFQYKEYVIGSFLIILFALLVFVMTRIITRMFRVDHAKRGDRLMKKGKYEKARKHFLKINAYTKAAFCALKMTRVEEAAEYFMLGKEFEMAAKYYAADGKYEKAAGVYEKIGKKIEAAEIYFRGGMPDKAARLYRDANLIKKAEEMYVKIDNFKEAALMYKEQYFKENANLGPSPNPKKVESLKNCALKAGQYLNRIGEYEPAADIFLKAGLIREAAMAFSKNKDFAKAAELCVQINDMEKAAQFYCDGKLFDKAIEIYENLGKQDEVAEVLEKAGKKAQAAELKAKISIDHHDVELGAKHLEDAGKFIEAAEIFVGVKKLAKAAELYEKGEAFDKAAEVYEKLKDFIKAADFYKRSHRYRSAALCYRELNDERAYLEMILLGESWLDAARFYLDKGEPDSAIEVLQKIEIDSPDYRMACNLLGKIFFAKNLMQLAKEKLFKAVEGKEMNKRNLELFYDLAVFQESNGQEIEALKIYEKILSFDFYFRDVLDRRKILEDRISSTTRSSIADSQDTQVSSGEGKRLTARVISDVINNRYEIREEIGRGGMGVVYKAFDRSLDRIVALKFLPSDFIRDTKDIEKFINEAKSAAKLNHSNIVTIHNIDQMDKDYFIVMEFVDGANLKEIIDLAHNLPFKTIHMIANQICDALSYAHKKNVIHRDIKNANIMWTNEKVVKITDFGLAKIMEDGLKTSTRVQGSPVYMSPEQVLGKDIDSRTDIYSFGISLYEMCTGKVPFERGDIGYHHLNTLAEPPEAIRNDLPGYLARIIKKCLNKKPSDRYSTADEIMSELASEKQQ
jgi:eukaryotic-like serine/threonine-protein kinase